MLSVHRFLQVDVELFITPSPEHELSTAFPLPTFPTTSLTRKTTSTDLKHPPIASFQVQVSTTQPSDHTGLLVHRPTRKRTQSVRQCQDNLPTRPTRPLFSRQQLPQPTLAHLTSSSTAPRARPIHVLPVLPSCPPPGACACHPRFHFHFLPIQITGRGQTPFSTLSPSGRLSPPPTINHKPPGPFAHQFQRTERLPPLDPP